MRTVALVVLLVSLVARAAAGRDIYVDNVSGSDSFSGQQARNIAGLNGPLRTIAAALRTAQSADHIILAQTDQPYRESISLVGRRHSGYADNPLVIEGNGAILDGSAKVSPTAWEHHRDNVFRFHPPRMGSGQLFLDNRPARRVAAESQAGPEPKLEPLHWYSRDGLIYFAVEPDKLPADYNLTYAQKDVGVTLFHVRNVAIIGLTVQGFHLDGINAHNSARGVYISGVTARGNGRAGIVVGGASKVEIDACLVGNNGQAQLLTLPYSRTVVRDSQLIPNTAPAVVRQGGYVYLDEQSKQRKQEQP
jgi:hypothetical protein